MTIDVDHWAQYLMDAVDNRTEVAAITKQVDQLSVESAYEIQAALIAARLAQGEKIAGAKLGLTSKAKQEQMGVDEPIFGWLFESGSLATGQEVVLDEMIHARCEAELVFVMGEDVEGTNITGSDILDATARVTGGIEVIDSRYEKFSFTLPDVIADNTSAARYMIGDGGSSDSSLDLETLGCVFEIDGEIAMTATGAALLGSPAECVALLANHLGRRGQKLEAGWTILAGALTDALPLAPGTHARARYANLGNVDVIAK